MAQSVRIGFVGFGEAAYHIAKGLQQPVTAFDINVTNTLLDRAREASLVVRPVQKTS